MPAFLDPKDTRLLIGAVTIMVVLVGLTYVLRPPPAQRSTGYPSTYSSDWDGAKAAFTLLQNSGYQAERWNMPPEELPIRLGQCNPDPCRTVGEPQRFGPSRNSAIRFCRWPLDCDWRKWWRFCSKRFVIAIPSHDVTPKTYLPLLPSPLTRGAPEITMIAPDAWTSSKSSELRIYGDSEKPVVVAYSVGKGQ